MVARHLGGDGQDAALVTVGAERVALAAEAIVPELVEAAPRVAGIAGVVATLNDLAATGARPVALLDTVVGDGAAVDDALAGIRAGADLYGVPVVGGHTTVTETGGRALSVLGVGRCRRALHVDRAAPGDTLSIALCTDGELVGDHGPMPFFSHLRGSRRARAADDLRLLPEAAEAGELRAARDVSMPGVVGSLIQMLEGTGLGCALDVEEIPRPQDSDLAAWLTAFMSYGFLLIGEPDALARRFGAAGLPIATVGRLDDSGVVTLVAGESARAVWNFSLDRLTGLGA
jgi:selenophosphate synthetase-related protein